MKKTLQSIALFTVILLALAGVYHLLGLPSSSEFISLAQTYYGTYGYGVVFVAALIEGLLLINWYLPGSAVAVIGVVLADGDPVRTVLTVALIILAFFITNIINYGLGRFGWYQLLLKFGLAEPLKTTQARLAKGAASAIFLSFIHPNISAVVATSAGMLRVPFGHFLILSLVGLLFWGTFWGVIVAYFGSHILELGTVWLMALLIGIYALYVLIRDHRKGLHRS